MHNIAIVFVVRRRKFYGRDNDLSDYALGRTTRHISHPGPKRKYQIATTTNKQKTYTHKQTMYVCRTKTIMQKYNYY